MNTHHQKAKASYFDGDFVSAERELRLAAEEGYLPAIFILGLEIHRHRFSESYQDEGLDLLKAASVKGHVPAGKWFNHLTVQRTKSVRIALSSLLNRLPLLVEGIWLRHFHPASDRIRIW